WDWGIHSLHGARSPCLMWGDDAVGLSHLRFGEGIDFSYAILIWEPTISTWVRSLPVTGHTIIDIVANIGCDTLLGATRVGVRGRVVSIETSPLLLELLKQNLSLNAFKNVRLIKAAAWNKFEDLPLFHS